SPASLPLKPGASMMDHDNGSSPDRPVPLVFTGGRSVPTAGVESTYDQILRYAFALSLVEGKTVLDAACGVGDGAELLARRASRVDGIDVRADAVSTAQRRYGERANLRFEAMGLLEFLETEKGTYDVVTVLEPVEDFRDPQRTIEQIKRALQPN